MRVLWLNHGVKVGELWEMAEVGMAVNLTRIAYCVVTIIAFDNHFWLCIIVKPMRTVVWSVRGLVS